MKPYCRLLISVFIAVSTAGAALAQKMIGGVPGGSEARRHFAATSGIPAPYASMRNPLPQDAKTVDRGRKVYVENCSTCHGATGKGDGVVGQKLSPGPSDLTSLMQMPMDHRDPYLYWAVVEGGTQFGAAMPPFKRALSSNDVWAVLTYMEAGFPRK